MTTIYILYGALILQTIGNTIVSHYNPEIFKSMISCQNSIDATIKRDSEKGLVSVQCRAYEVKTK